MRETTKCLHAGYSPKNSEPRVMPIVQSTTYVYDSTADVAAVFDDPTKSLIYSRCCEPHGNGGRGQDRGAGGRRGRNVHRVRTGREPHGVCSTYARRATA